MGFIWVLRKQITNEDKIEIALRYKSEYISIINERNVAEYTRRPTKKKFSRHTRLRIRHCGLRSGCFPVRDWKTSVSVEAQRQKVQELLT